MGGDYALEFVFGREPAFGLYAKFRYALLAFRTLLPSCFRAFVTSDMDIFRWENVHYFIKHVVDKCKGRVISRTQHVGRHSPSAPYTVWPSCTAKTGVGRKCCKHVSRQVNLRDYGDMASGRVLHDIACLLFGEVSSYRLVVIYA